MERIERSQSTIGQVLRTSTHRPDKMDPTNKDDEKTVTKTPRPQDLRTSYGGEDFASGKKQEYARSHQDGVQQLRDNLPSDHGTGHGTIKSHAGQVELVVTIVQAEGVVDITSSGMFPWSSKSKPQGRFFRVRVLDVVEGGRVLDHAETSSTCAQGFEFRWDAGGEKGEDLHFLLEPMSWNRGVSLEVEMLHRESTGDGFLLGRGQTALKDMEYLGNGEFKPQWVHLAYEGKPKGRVKIVVFITSIASIALSSWRTTEPDADGAANGSDIYGSKLNGSGNTDKKVRQSVGDVGGQQEDNKPRILTVEECQDPKAAVSSHPRPLKWGMTRMSDLKNTITAGMAHAANLKAFKKQTTGGGKTDPMEKSNASRGQSEIRGEGDSSVKSDSEKRSTTKDEVEQQVTRENVTSALPAEDDRHVERGFLTTRHGMHSFRKSLQIELTGASGNSSVDCEQSRQGLQEEGSNLYAAEEGLDCSSRGNRGSPEHLQKKGRSRSPSSGKTLESKKRSVLSQHPEGDEAVEEIEEPTGLRKKTGPIDNAVKDHASDPDAAPVPYYVDTAPLTDSKKMAGRRYSLHQVGSGSSLRSHLLENVTRNIHASKGKFIDSSSSGSEGGDRYSESDGDSEHTPADADGEYTPPGANDNIAASEAQGESVVITQNISPSVFTESLKLTAARLKTTLSSQVFSASRKTFGWPKSRVKDTEGGDEGGRDSCPPIASRTDSGDQTNQSNLLPFAVEMGQASTDIPASGDALPDASSTTSTLLVVRVLRASGLPENLAKGSFGRMKQGATQDPYVRLKLCNVVAETSAVKGGGRECRWGKKKEGEIVEVPVPPSALSEGNRLESLQLSLEVLNKANEETEKDILLGSVKLLISGWLGRRAAWAELELRGSRGGRVKLSIGVKDILKAELEVSQSSQKLKTEHLRIGYERLLTADTASTSANSQPVRVHTLGDNTVTDLGQNPDKKQYRDNEYAGKVGSISTINEDEGGERDSVRRSRSSSRASEGADISRKKTGGASCGHYEHSTSVPPIQEVEDLHETRAAQDASRNKRNAAAARDSASGDPTLGSEDGSPPPRGEQVTACSVEHVQRLPADLAGGGGGTVKITIRVRKADSLAASFVTKTMFGRTNKIAIHNPYVVLDVCGSKLSTSAVIGGGSKCRWSGEHGRALVWFVSYADLTAAGWGQAPWESPKLRVEMWDQISPSKTTDTFIGSTDVSLKDVLGIGATWIDISRENINTGRVKVHVESPDLEQNVFLDRHGNVSEVPKKMEPKGHMEPEAHRKPPYSRGHSFGGDGPNETRVVPAERNREREVKTITITTPGRGASDSEVVPRSGIQHDPESMQAKHDASSSVVGKRPTSFSGSDSASQVADHHPLPSDSYGAHILGLAQRKISEDLTMSHFGGKYLKEEAGEPDDIDGHGIPNEDKRSTSSKLEYAPADEVFGGLQRRLLGGTATALDLTAIGATAVHARISPGDETTSMLWANVSGHITPASINVSATPAPQNTQTEGQGSHSPYTTPSGFDESNGDENVCSRLLKSRGDLSFEISHKHSVACANETSERRRTALSRDEDSKGGAKGDGNEDRNRKSMEMIAANSSSSIQVSSTGKHSRLQPGPAVPSTRIDSSTVVLIPGSAQECKIKRIARARQIAQRRMGMNRASGALTRGHSGQRYIHPPVSIVAVEKIDQVSAVTTIQCTFRGWLARRSHRCYQQAAVHIQGAFWGHRERKHFLELGGRTRRAREEEQRARERRSRIAATQQELYLLRRIPAKDLGKIHFLRDSAMASRIQRFWRRLCGGVHFDKSARERGTRKGSQEPERGQRRERGKEWVASEGRKTITAPEIKWLRSNRVPASAMTLEALRRRVATRQRAKECSSNETRQHSMCRTSAQKVPRRKVDAGERMIGTVEGIYESLITHREKASSLMAALNRSATEHIASAKHRSERLDKFRSLQDQLLDPPKLDGGASRLQSNTHDSSTGTAVGISKQLREWKVGVDHSKWQVDTESLEQQCRGERAHALATMVAREAGNKWWTVSLPADVGYDELVDIRRVESPWETASLCTGRRRRNARTSTNASGEVGSERKYDSDEASLWWYSFASTGTGSTEGQRREDTAFTELLERIKTSQVRREERLEDQNRARRLRIARKSQRIVHEVVRQQDAARYSGLSCLRGRVTAVQKRAAIIIQSRVRGTLQRKMTATLRAEMRVFGALQILVNELRRPELEDKDSKGPLRGLADVLAEHAGKNEVDRRRLLASAVAARHTVPTFPTNVPQSIPQPPLVLYEQDKSRTISMDKDRTKTGTISRL